MEKKYFTAIFLLFPYIFFIDDIGGPKPEDEHELLWHEVIPEKKTVCWECGQYFQIVAKKEPSIGDDHGHHH